MTHCFFLTVSLCRKIKPHTDTLTQPDTLKFCSLCQTNRLPCLAFSRFDTVTQKKTPKSGFWGTFVIFRVCVSRIACSVWLSAVSTQKKDGILKGGSCGETY